MENRYFIDDATNTALVFPDLLKLSFIAESIDGGDVTISIDAELVADPKEIAKFHAARQIVLGDTFFVLRRPQHNGVIDFQFLPTGGLAGRVVLVIKAASSAEVKKLATTDPKFFDPEYSGRTENFTSKVEIAKVSLSDIEIERVRNKAGLIAQIQLLSETVTANIKQTDIKYALHLAEKLINDEGLVNKIDGIWHLTLPSGGKIIRLVEVQEIVSRVAGDADEIRLA
jgi:hypothetical protein